MRLILMFFILVLCIGCAKTPNLGIIQIQFTFHEATADLVPSYQTSIWLEDGQNNYMKTLFLSEYLSYGGYNDSTICPAWNSVADWDNAPMESFFHSLKTEWVVFEDYKTRSEARSSLFSYIELFYNRKRRHSSLGNKSPLAFENSMAVP